MPNIAIVSGLAALGIGALVPFVAAGQDTEVAARDIDVAALRELDDDDREFRHEGFTIEEIEDMDLVRDGNVVGEVEAVLADASGNVVALAVEHRRPGDDDEVVVPIEDVTFSSDRREVETSLSDDDLAALPRWDD